MKKRVLFINPTKNDHMVVNRIHMGFTLMGEILSSLGHNVKLVDYSFLRWLRNDIQVSDIEELLNEFNPDVIGISVFTYLYDECQEMLEKVTNITQAPVILGGPHVTFFPEDFMKDKRVSYIVRGEAENIISDLISNSKKESVPVVINCPILDPQGIPKINLDIAVGNNYLRVYQIQLSRGCPFSCTFCNVGLTAGRKVRARDLESCIAQIKEVKNRYPNIEKIDITDDCPNFDKERFKKFLRMFKAINTGCVLTVDNMRADLLDEEMIRLYKEAGGRNICLGVESGNIEVFRLVNKSETLETIIHAAALIRKYQLELGLCFVIGLPEDDYEKNEDSIELANRIKPDYIFWNMCIPWPNTKVYDWFKENGTIEDVRNFSTLIDAKLNFGIPPVWSPNFNKKERIRAWLRANLETYAFPIFYWGNLRYLPFNIVKIFYLSFKYKVLSSFFKYLGGVILRKIPSMLMIILRRFSWKIKMKSLLEEGQLILENNTKNKSCPPILQ